MSQQNLLFDNNFYSELVFSDGSRNPPQAIATIKSQPSDFQVDEIMEVENSGEGEHIWLQITKQRTHSDQVAKSLAYLSDIHPKDIGVSGMKDFQADTTQWFSVWLPGIKDDALPDWHEIDSDAVQIKNICRHNRKLKRGTHKGNRFKILLRDIEGDHDELEQRLVSIKTQGVPSYFGEQRFGRGASNLQQAQSWLASGRKIKQRQKRSMLLSSARSWMFNCVLSKRLQAGTWLTPHLGEPLNLEGSKQFFIAENLSEAQTRIQMTDIHTTGPLWGKGVVETMKQAHDLNVFETEIIDQFEVFRSGLEREGLDYDRRAVRFVPQGLNWKFIEHEERSKLTNTLHHLELNFTLGRGQYATSLLRELVQAR